MLIKRASIILKKKMLNVRFLNNNKKYNEIKKNMFFVGKGIINKSDKLNEFNNIKILLQPKKLKNTESIINNTKKN